jgi:hypothetical protein
MEDLILEPYEVPVGYALQGVVGYEDVLNPGFVTGELRDEILSGDAVGASPDLVKRVYMVHYEGSDSDKLTIVVLEYEKLANMKSDLTNISSNIVKQGVEGYATVTAIDNYVIYLYDDNSPELTAQLTEKLQSKLPD